MAKPAAAPAAPAPAKTTKPRTGARAQAIPEPPDEAPAKAAPKAKSKAPPAPAPAPAPATAGAKAPKAKAAPKPAADARADRKRFQAAAETLKLIGDPGRLEMVVMLFGGEQYVAQISEALDMSQPAVSHHLMMLRHAGVMRVRRDGKNNYYQLTDKGNALAGIAAKLMTSPKAAAPS